MNEKEAMELLSKHLGPNYYIIDCYEKWDDIYLFHVKAIKDKNDGRIIPDAYGVSRSGKILNEDDILAKMRESEPIA